MGSPGDLLYWLSYLAPTNIVITFLIYFAVNVIKSNMDITPPIAIGMPVYNGGVYLRHALDSLVSQSFSNYVLLISDNASTDDTADICHEYVRTDQRIHYLRQPKNIGAEANFRYVFEATESKYFMWAAADDVRSTDFIEQNLAFLQSNPDYLGSTSPVRFQGREFDEVAMGDAPLADDDPYQRLVDFFVAWHANGRFYSLFRREAVAEWVRHDNRFFGSDWTLITHLAATGKLNRADGGWIQLGIRGASNTTDIFSWYRQGWLDWVFPFQKLSVDTWRLMPDAKLRQKLILASRLARLNLHAFIKQMQIMINKRYTLNK